MLTIWRFCVPKFVDIEPELLELGYLKTCKWSGFLDTVYVLLVFTVVYKFWHLPYGNCNGMHVMQVYTVLSF